MEGTILFAGGGTGGHLNPGIAIGELLNASYPKVRIGFVGSERPIESKILLERGFKHYPLPIDPLPKWKRNPIGAGYRGLRACLQAGRLLAPPSRPIAVVGLGGFASLPLVFQAQRRSIPTLLIENNTIPGRVTRWTAPRARAICVTFESTLSRFPNALLTGNPIRKQIADLFHTPLPCSARTIGVLGGSQGARSLNELVLDWVRNSPEDLAGWSIWHQTGGEDFDHYQNGYRQAGLEADIFPFDPNLDQRLSKTSIVITRTGASTLAELACAGCVPILVPLMTSADGHQLENAKFLETRGIGISISPPDKNLGKGTRLISMQEQLRRGVLRLMGNQTEREHRARLFREWSKPKAAELVVEVLEKIINPASP